ncbi:MAG: LicD family protein [Defluviitaleaceae bacterium]|nr:LicD family protein [Defluviitaleaceae bacterium]
MTKLRKLQLAELQLLQELDRICRKHGINYHLTSGTLLGAIRHKGFIPWDDDLDVAMLLDDYVEFCNICKDELNVKKFFLQTMDTDPYHRYIFAKFRIQNTLCVRKKQEHMKHHHGIYIDIFPLYPVPQGIFLFKIFAKIVTKCKTILWSPVGAVSEKKYKIYSLIPKKIPKKTIDFLVSRCKKSIFVSSLGCPSFLKVRRLASDCQDLVEGEFEGQNFFIPANYDALLKSFYGNYMILPPKHKRQGHHPAAMIDFGNILKGDNP